MRRVRDTRVGGRHEPLAAVAPAVLVVAFVLPFTGSGLVPLGLLDLVGNVLLEAVIFVTFVAGLYALARSPFIRRLYTVRAFYAVVAFSAAYVLKFGTDGLMALGLSRQVAGSVVVAVVVAACLYGLYWFATRKIDW